MTAFMVHFYAKVLWGYRNHWGLKINGTDSTDPTRRGGQIQSVFSYYEIYLTAGSLNPSYTKHCLCTLDFSYFSPLPLLLFSFSFSFYFPPPCPCDMPEALFYSLVMNCPNSHGRFRMLKSRRSPELTKGSCVMRA